MISPSLSQKGVYDAWRLKEETRDGGRDARRRPAGARQNLNPFKQLPHFAGVYNSWEAAPGAGMENCAAENTSAPGKPTGRERAREFPWKKDSP